MVVSEEALVAPVIVPDVTSPAAAKATAAGPAYIVLGGISLSHFLNDTMQSLIPSVYPILKESHALDFASISSFSWRRTRRGPSSVDRWAIASAANT